MPREFSGLRLAEEDRDGVQTPVAIVRYIEYEGDKVLGVRRIGYENPPINKETPRQEQLAWAIQKIKEEN